MDIVLLKRILIIITALALAGGAASQVIVDPDTKDDIRISLTHMYDDNDDLAEEYIEILEDLQDIISDYTEYRDELSPEQRALHPLAFDIFRKGLKSGRYDEGYETLLTDIETFIEELAKLEAAHADKEDRKRAKCCRVVRNLRRELDMLVNLLEDYAIQVKTRKVYTVALDKFQEELAGKLAQLKITIAEDDSELTINLGDLKEIEFEQLAEMEKALKALEKKGLIPSSRASTGSAPRAPDGPFWFTPPKVPEPTHGIEKQYTASVEYERSGTVVRVENPFGSIVVAGWDKETVAAKLLVMVNSGSSSKNKEFFDKSGVKAEKSGEEIKIVAELPKIKNPNFELLVSKLVVMVPFNAPVVCDNSHGQITVSDLEAGVIIDGDRSQASIMRVKGTVEAKSQNGSVLLTDVSGDIRAEVDHGSFVATDCQGSINLVGQHFESSLVGCTGPANISGIGTASIIDHFGDLTVDNSKGQVQIDNLDGNLIATNSFQPLIVRRVSGSASLNNRHGEIKAEGISGNLTASMTGGKMTGADLRGPINLDVEGGDVNLSLVSRLEGKSTITANNCTLTLSLSDYTDVQFLADISQGTLRTQAPIEIDRNGKTVSAEGKFGRATGTLNVSGNVLTLFINESR